MNQVPAPSPWLLRWAHLLRPRGTVLDVACGGGRHVHWLAAQGFQVTGVDRDVAALAPLAALGDMHVADIENAPWPLPGRTFDAVLATHYLWRPLQATLLAALAEGGVYIHETFACGQQTVGRPSRPEFLLKAGELLAMARGLHVVAYEDGYLDTPPRFLQRIVAVKPVQATTASPAPARFPLLAPG